MRDRKKERFGRYEILAELGRGAMGIVYKARDPKINRVVAVKTISLAGQPADQERDYRERFFREAEAAGRLSHPGIVTVFDVGEEPETRSPYIVMEYVQGQSLDKLLLSRGDRKLPPEEALQLALELAEALDCAHGQGVVHRDIKPSNILLTKEGHAKIADFGVAKLNLAEITASGRVFGTPAYMSPEQLNGEEIDGRSDLFSLGVILYTALTGYRPFQGNSAMTVAFKVVNRDPVPATVLDNELPPGLDYIISRAIAKDPSQRYQRGMEMVLDIQDLRAGREPWSKAKEPGSADPVQQANEKTDVFLNAAVALKSRSRDEQEDRGAIAVLLERMRSNRVLSIGLLAVFFALTTRAAWVLVHSRAGEKSLSRHSSKNLPILPDNVPAIIPPPVQTANAPIADRQNPASAVATSVSRPRVRKEVRPQAQRNYSPSAILEIEVDHNFSQANLSLWVDDRLAFTHELEGTEKKRLVVFHHVQGHEFHAVEVPAGKHLLRVEVRSKSGAHTGTLHAEFAGGGEKMLRVQFDKNERMDLNLQ